MECVYTAAECIKIKSNSDKNRNKTQSWFYAECKMLRVQTLKALQSLEDCALLSH